MDDGLQFGSRQVWLTSYDPKRLGIFIDRIPKALFFANDVWSKAINCLFSFDKCRINVWSACGLNMVLSSKSVSQRLSSNFKWTFHTSSRTNFTDLIKNVECIENKTSDYEKWLNDEISTNTVGSPLRFNESIIIVINTPPWEESVDEESAKIDAIYRFKVVERNWLKIIELPTADLKSSISCDLLSTLPQYKKSNCAIFNPIIRSVKNNRILNTLFKFFGVRSIWLTKWYRNISGVYQ